MNLKSKINILLLFLLFFCSDLKAQRIEIINNEKYSLDSLKKYLNDKKLIMLCFEGGFKGEKMKIESNKRVLFNDSLLTNEKIGIAKRIFFNKKLLPSKIYFAGKVYKLSNAKNKFIYIAYRNDKLLFDYSNTYRLFK